MNGGRWNREIRLATDAGTDLNPVAATDSEGRVWVAWQGFRNGNLEILEALRKRRVYGATDNILADVRCGAHFMGEEFSTSEAPVIAVKLWGSGKFANVHVILAPSSH